MQVIKEDFLHFIWQNKKINAQNISTTEGAGLQIIDFGQSNSLAGPDFFNAKIEIDGQLWAGNVEIHVKASDWYVHSHENDLNYNNVILHVVWDNDVEVFRSDGTSIPSLELKNYVDPKLLGSYRQLLRHKKFINCDKDFNLIDDFTRSHWYERLFVERLQQKSTLIFELLKRTQNDWEKVLFCLLMKNFGLNHNGLIFFEAAERLDFSIFRKVVGEPDLTEALLYGMLGMLHNEAEPIDAKQQQLKQEFDYLSTKFQLDTNFLTKPNFYGLRPNNFPTIRLSQLANLYHKNENLFQVLIKADTLEEIYSIFQVKAGSYWDNHYVFGKETKSRPKTLSRSFIELLAINTIIPIKFCYSKSMGKTIDEKLMELAMNLGSETNTIIKKFGILAQPAKNALESQAQLQLYNNYCYKNRCLNCSIGHKLLLTIN